MSDYYPSPDELRDAWINDYDPPVRSSEAVESNELDGQATNLGGSVGVATDVHEPEPVSAVRQTDKAGTIPPAQNITAKGTVGEMPMQSEAEYIARQSLLDDRTEATCEWFDSLPKPPEPLPWIEAPQATDRHPFQ